MAKDNILPIILIGVGILLLSNLLQSENKWNLISDDTFAYFCSQEEPIPQFEIKVSTHDTLNDCRDACVEASQRPFSEVRCLELV